MRKVPFQGTIQNYLRAAQLKHDLAKEGWLFSPYRFNMILKQTPEWQRHYLHFSVCQKVVLDVGAGEGETARLFLQFGAKRVICIEPEESAFRWLKNNAATHRDLLEIYQKQFTLADLQRPFEILKMDTEGYEECLLGIKLKIPAVVEVHGLPLVERFKKDGWYIEPLNAEVAKGYGCTNYAYWTP